MSSDSRTLALGVTVTLLASTFLAFGLLFDASTDPYVKSYLASLLGALITASLVWWMLSRRRAPRAEDRSPARLARKADAVDALTEALLAAGASKLDAAATRRLHDELHRAARTLSDATLERTSAYVQAALEDEPVEGELLELMLQFRTELGLGADAEAPALRELRRALYALGMQREAIAQIVATARQLFGALKKIAADEESEWRFTSPREAAGASVIAFATTDGALEGQLRIPYPKEPRPRVEATLEVRTASHNLVVRERQRELRRALKKLGYGRPREASEDAVDPHDQFAVGVVFDHPDEPYLNRANNLVDLLDDTRDAIDAALAAVEDLDEPAARA